MSDPDTTTDASADGGGDSATSSRGSLRRRLLRWLAGLGVVSFFAGLLTPLKDLALAVEATSGEGAPNLVGQRLVYAHSHKAEPSGHLHEEGMTVHPDHLSVPDAAIVFPAELTGQARYPILLHHLEEDKIGPPTDPELADQGFVAYSAVCTHLGCTVDWTEHPHEVGQAHDHCPCHVGEFDPYRGARVLAGPAPRPLPQIGIAVEEDQIVLTTQFEEPVGGE